MINMKPSEKYINATAARNNFFDLLEKVKKQSLPMHITIKGIPEVVMMSEEGYEGLLATIETLEDPELVKAIKEGEEDIKAGRYTSWEKVKKEMDLENYLVADKSKKQYDVSHGSLQKSRKKSQKTR